VKIDIATTNVHATGQINPKEIRTPGGFRLARDSMGEVAVPVQALYGAQTQRALDNFPISGLRLPRSFIKSLGLIKRAAARANNQLGLIPLDRALAIEQAAIGVVHGDYDGEFGIDVFQSGSGTSTNMNANEVIACAASRRTGLSIHPNDDVNRSQSSNDVIPTAIHLSAALRVREGLVPALTQLRDGLSEKAEAFADIEKTARTHLQDAVPIKLGDEFSGYAHQMECSLKRIETALDGVHELPLGGTAAGTGLNAPHGFSRIAIAHLSEWTGLPLREAENHFEAQAARDAVCFLSGALRCCAIALGKIANDIRWLASGPSCGLAELRLPETQPGSSIMPGKVNPVIAESALMVCAQVIGHDAAIAWAGASGNFELNTMMPLLAYDLLESIELLSAAAMNFNDRCIRGIDADRERLTEFARASLGQITALVPEIGYEKAAKIAREARRSGRSLEDVMGEKNGPS
jgi:fumarate hydratase class II